MNWLCQIDHNVNLISQSICRKQLFLTGHIGTYRYPHPIRSDWLNIYLMMIFERDICLVFSIVHKHKYTSTFSVLFKHLKKVTHEFRCISLPKKTIIHNFCLSISTWVDNNSALNWDEQLMKIKSKIVKEQFVIRNLKKAEQYQSS